MRYPVNFIGITKPFKKGSHNGIDLGWNNSYGGKNQPIFAVDDGKVIYNRFQGSKSGGYVIMIQHANGYVSEYGHLLKDSQLIKEGQYVKKGQQIASMGKSGNSSGEHLHFGLYKGTSINYSKNNFVNPIDYLCVFDNQVVANSTQKSYKLYATKVVKGVISEPLNVRNKDNKIVLGLYNGQEIEYYGKTLLGKAKIDNLRDWTTIDKYLK